MALDSRFGLGKEVKGRMKHKSCEKNSNRQRKKC